MNSIGNKIKELRKKQRLSLSMVASLLGITRQAVNLWENEKSMPKLKRLKQLSEILKCKIEDLIMA